MNHPLVWLQPVQAAAYTAGSLASYVASRESKINSSCESRACWRFLHELPGWKEGFVEWRFCMFENVGSFMRVSPKGVKTWLEAD